MGEYVFKQAYISIEKRSLQKISLAPNRPKCPDKPEETRVLDVYRKSRLNLVAKVFFKQLIISETLQTVEWYREKY